MTRQHAAVSRRGWQLANYSRGAWSAISSPGWKTREQTAGIIDDERYRGLSLGSEEALTRDFPWKIYSFWQIRHEN